MRGMADTLAEILEIIRTTTTGERRSAIIARFGGTTIYVPKLDGRQQVAELVALGVNRRTATWKVRGR